MTTVSSLLISNFLDVRQLLLRWGGHFWLEAHLQSLLRRFAKPGSSPGQAPRFPQVLHPCRCWHPHCPLHLQNPSMLATSMIQYSSQLFPFIVHQSGLPLTMDIDRFHACNGRLCILINVLSHNLSITMADGEGGLHVCHATCVCNICNLVTTLQTTNQLYVWHYWIKPWTTISCLIAWLVALVTRFGWDTIDCLIVLIKWFHGTFNSNQKSLKTTMFKVTLAIPVRHRVSLLERVPHAAFFWQNVPRSA